MASQSRPVSGARLRLARQPTQANTGTENAMRRHSRVTESNGTAWGTA